MPCGFPECSVYDFRFQYSMRVTNSTSNTQIGTNMLQNVGNASKVKIMEYPLLPSP